MTTTETSWIEKQINTDFSPFLSGISTEQLDATMEWSRHFVENDHVFIRVKVIDGTIYQFDNNENEANCPAVVFHLNKIMSKGKLPNLDFIYFHGAGPKLINSLDQPVPGPVLTGNKIDGDSGAILFHDRMTAVYNDKLYSWNKSIDDVNKAIAKTPWNSKQEKLIWYGQISDFKLKDWSYIHSWLDHSKRGQLYRLGQQFPNELKVGITAFHELDIRNISPNIPQSSIKSIKYHMQNKYQIVLDGYTCSNPSFAWKLLSNCVCLKVDSPIYQWFYKGLTEGIHYLSIKEDFSNLLPTIERLRADDEYALKIANAGREWAKENLVEDSLLVEYCSKVLKKYASLQKFKPSLSNKEKNSFLGRQEYENLKTLLPFDEHSFFSKCNEQALSYLIKKFNCKKVVELGSWLGASTRCIAKALPDDGLVFAVDHWKGSAEHYQPDRQDVRHILPTLYKQFLSNGIHSGLSHKIVPRKMSTDYAAKSMNITADLIFVDAAHGEEAIYNDISNWVPFLKENGIICGSNWMWNKDKGKYSIQRAVKRYAKENKLYIETYGLTFWMLKKTPIKILQKNQYPYIYPTGICNLRHQVVSLFQRCQSRIKYRCNKWRSKLSSKRSK